MKRGAQYFQEENGNGNLCVISNVSELVFTYRNGQILMWNKVQIVLDLCPIALYNGTINDEKSEKL